MKADRGEVRALRVKAIDTVNQISYIGLHRQGRYQIPDLPPGQLLRRYRRGGFRRAQRRTSRLLLQGRTPRTSRSDSSRSLRSAGAAGAAAQSNYGATRIATDGTIVELWISISCIRRARARDVMVKECFVAGEADRLAPQRAARRGAVAPCCATHVRRGWPRRRHERRSAADGPRSRLEGPGRTDRQVPDGGLRPGSSRAT